MTQQFVARTVSESTFLYIYTFLHHLALTYGGRFGAHRLTADIIDIHWHNGDTRQIVAPRSLVREIQLD